jgi:Asp-tRNA(Asn)/Glu-tRNA(Gln) amidotransferase A subunit family amidase
MLLEYLQIAGAEPPVTLDAFLDACTQRDLCRAQILRQMENVPVLLSPVSLAPAFRHGEGAWRPATPASFRESMRHSQWLNLAGLPGLSLPAAFSNDGLPIGVQLIGRPFEEPLLLAVAESLDQSLNAARFPSID